eukprot:TRINITY_DN5274_c0_g1_i1.p1 TRINITY_DN5274_c0_g1~~TRINITY_DN5274_c0_g1_i1.p1  ORF type:complete len:804 (+),score=134.24 TRINITY_DN5274_c0_g1_i1:28-2412(+)
MASDTTPFGLTAVVHHEADVRGVAPANGPGLHAAFITCSRDHTAKLWKCDDHGDYSEAKTFAGHTGFVYAAAVVPPKISGAPASIVTCSHDKTAIVWDAETGNPLNVLTGHDGPVCCVGVTLSGSVVTGSWDQKAIIWDDAGSALTKLVAHSKSVLCLCCLSDGNLVTGSADQTLILWSSSGRKSVTFSGGHTDAVRSVKEVPGIGIVSAANDGMVILWAFSGEQLQMFAGHTSLVYCVAVLSSSEFVSGSEDRTMRVWKGGQCVQTITLPGHIWDVCVLENGDVVSGTTDKVARVWTRTAARVNINLSALLEEDLAKQQVSTKVVGGVDITKLPNEAALEQPGSQDGEIKMVKRSSHPSAEVFTWSSFDRKWTKTGDLVDNPEEGHKQYHNGKWYDYVFPVDLNGDGTGNFKLGYNRGENPYEAAQRFIWENAEQGMGQHFLDEIATFIAQQTGQMNVDDPLQGAQYSEYARESARLQAEGTYTPQTREQILAKLENAPVAYSKYMQEALQREKEEREQTAGTASTEDTSVLVDFLRFDQAINADGLRKKTNEFNAELVGLPSQLEDSELRSLEDLISGSHSANAAAVLCKMLTWPVEKRFPALDIIRLLAIKSPEALLTPEAEGVWEALLSFLNGSAATGAEEMLLSRALTNIVAHPNLRERLVPATAQVITACRGAMKSKQQNCRVAYASFFQNLAVMFATSGAEHIEELNAFCPFLTDFLLHEAHSPILMMLLRSVYTLLKPTSAVAAAAAKRFRECFMKPCLDGKTQFGDSSVIALSRRIVADFFATDE